jgi:cell division protein FtsL
MAIREQVTIEVDVEGEGLKKLAADAKKTKRALNEVDKASDKAGASLGQQAELAERMRAALGPLGDVLGDVTGGFDDTIVALEGFGAAQVAATAIALAGVAAFLKFTGAIIETIVSIDDMAEALRERHDPEISEAVANVQELNRELKDLGVTYDAQWVLLTDKFVPALKGVVAVAEVLVPKFGQIVDLGLDMAVSFSQLGAAVATVSGALAVVGEIDEQREALDRLGYSITEVDGNLYALRDEFDQYAQSDEFEGSFYAVSDATTDLKDALDASRESARKAREEMRRLAEAKRDAERAAKDAAKGFLDADFQLKKVTETTQVGGRAFNELGAEVQETKDQAETNIKAMGKVTLAEVEKVLQTTGAVATGVGEIYNSTLKLRLQNEKEGSEAHKKLLKEQFAANKAFAIVDATIATALAVVQALGAGPVVGAVLAAVAAATGAAQIAVIAAQKPPSFHRGGIMPDEQASFGGAAITRQNEAGVVFTAQGQRTFADAVNALNRGDSQGGGGITVMLDSQPIRGVVHQMGQADPAYGHRRRQ